MLRTRILRPRWLTIALVLWSAAWMSLPVPGEGAPLPPARASASGEVPGTGVDVAALQEALVASGTATPKGKPRESKPKGRKSRLSRAAQTIVAELERGRKRGKTRTLKRQGCRTRGVAGPLMEDGLAVVADEVDFFWRGAEFLASR